MQSLLDWQSGVSVHDMGHKGAADGTFPSSDGMEVAEVNLNIYTITSYGIVIFVCTI